MTTQQTHDNNQLIHEYHIIRLMCYWWFGPVRHSEHNSIVMFIFNGIRNKTNLVCAFICNGNLVIHIHHI